jgi:hypothetical protein
MAGSIYVPILSSFNPSGVNNARKSLGGLAGAFDGVKRALGLASAGFVAFRAVSETIDFGRSSIVAARDLERNLNALDSVFGELAPRMEQFAQNGVDIGLSQIDTAKASTFLGSVLKQAGFEMEDVAAQTESLVGLASDLATTYGYDVSEALSGMTALFRGEYDPIEKFGVAMKQSEVNAVLAANKMGNLTGAARRNAEQMARLALLYERTADAQGAFKEGTGTLFVEQQRLQAIFANLQSEVGKALIPALVKVAETLQPLVRTLAPAITFLFTQFADIIEILSGKLTNTQSNLYNFVQVLGGLFAVLKLILPVILDNAIAIGGLIALYRTVNGAVKLAAATQLAYTTITAAATASTAASTAATTASAGATVAATASKVANTAATTASVGATVAATGATVASTGATVASTVATTAATGATTGLATALRATPWGALATGVAILAVVGYNIADAMHKAYMETEGVSEAFDKLSKGATIGGPRVGAGRAAQGGAYANRRNFEDIVPMYKPAPIALNYNTEAISEAEKAQTEFEKYLKELLKNFSGAVEATETSAKKTGAATKKVIDEQAAALKKQAEALADFKKSVSDVVPALRPLAVAALEIGEFERQAVDAFDAISEAVKKGFADKTVTQEAANVIYDYIAVEGKALRDLARQRDVLLKKINIAQEITGSIVGAANITNTESKKVTESVSKLVDGIAITVTKTFDNVVAGDITESFKKLVTKTKDFAKNLVTLKKLGLNGTLFKQIVDAGADAGGATAEAIIAGGADTVNELNALFGELNDAGSQIAAESTEIFYEAGKGITNAFVEGLKSQEQALLAELQSMIAAIEEALNIMINNLDKLKMGEKTVLASSLDTFDYARLLAGTGNPLTAEDVRFANIGQRAGATINVYNTVKTGVLSEGKALGQTFTALTNQYTKASG